MKYSGTGKIYPKNYFRLSEQVIPTGEGQTQDSPN